MFVWVTGFKNPLLVQASYCMLKLLKKLWKEPILESNVCPHFKGGTEDTSSEQKVVEKKRTYPKRNKTVKADEAPERIRDMTVTKKAYAKWKPLSSSTKKYTKQVLESTIL